mmetsp:Transcript_8049/g.29881  ORF Transcript_8049/g.29881 Transcript_8049/m.29881 type:complete len:626 (-) Transcript_8049:117-1994(-)|eukprot:CAMPEP_0117450512 /NCGR_PEP_ID=MMETSP0759-20121206/8506_1 /TAXON_ID=63605 /ORGANISM="Percolomonas cosmopolitus, Strain WS" /LENGTH=625 /DNA_ID=CAMNT_0005243035 /DNA_START=134 /DNA_END=2011 /DNA_ORIENTATION=+
MKQYKPPKYKKNKFLKNFYNGNESNRGAAALQQSDRNDQQNSYATPQDQHFLVSNMNGKRRLKRNLVSMDEGAAIVAMMEPAESGHHHQDTNTPLFSRSKRGPLSKYKHAIMFSNRIGKPKKRHSVTGGSVEGKKAHSARKHSERRTVEFASTSALNQSDSAAFQQMELDRRAFLQNSSGSSAPELSSFDFMAPSVEVKSRGTQTADDALLIRLQSENDQLHKKIAKLEFEKDEQKKTLRIIEELFSEPQAVRRELSKWRESQNGDEDDNVAQAATTNSSNTTTQPAETKNTNAMLPPKHKSRSAHHTKKSSKRHYNNHHTTNSDSLAVKDTRYQTSTSPRRSLNLSNASEDATETRTSTEKLVITKMTSPSNAKRKARAPARRYKPAATSSDAMSEDLTELPNPTVADDESIMANMSTRGISSVMSHRVDAMPAPEDDMDDLDSVEPTLSAVESSPEKEQRSIKAHVVLSVPSVGMPVRIRSANRSEHDGDYNETRSTDVQYTIAGSDIAASLPLPSSKRAFDNESTKTLPITATEHANDAQNRGRANPGDNESITTGAPVDASSMVALADASSVCASARTSSTAPVDIPPLKKSTLLSLPDINEFRFVEDFDHLAGNAATGHL